MTTLDEVIAEVERATEGSRQLDVEIFLVIVDFSRLNSWRNHLAMRPRGEVPDPIRYASHAAPAYTSSLDAALTLVPEGCAWQITKCLDDLPCVAKVQKRSVDAPGFGVWEEVSTKTPPLALVLAALRARKTMEES